MQGKPPLIDRKRKLIMGWSPKAGCTVAVKMFLDHMGLLEEALRHNPWVHNYREYVFYKNHPPPTSEEHRDVRYFKFKVVRNPYDRAVSSFLHWIRRGRLGSFRDFLEEQKDRKTPINFHFAPQYCEHKYNRIVKIESFAEEMAKINGELGTAFRLGTTFRTDFSIEHGMVQAEPKGVCVSQVRFAAPLPAIVPAYRDFYDVACRRDVESLYRDDFLCYGYAWGEHVL